MLGTHRKTSWLTHLDWRYRTKVTHFPYFVTDFPEFRPFSRNRHIYFKSRIYTDQNNLKVPKIEVFNQESECYKILSFWYFHPHKVDIDISSYSWCNNKYIKMDARLMRAVAKITGLNNSDRRTICHILTTDGELSFFILFKIKM